MATTLAAAALASGAASYLFAFLRERAPEVRSSRIYFAWLGLALTVIGSAVLLPAPAPALLWAFLCVAAVVLGRTFEPAILQPQGTVFALAAAIASGLLGAEMRAFTGEHARLALPSPAALVTLGAITVAAVLLLVERPAAGSFPALVATLLCAVGIGGIAVVVLDRPAEALLAAPLPALRTVIISLSAYILARRWRSTRRTELRTLAYFALVAGGLKLLFEDLPGGTPMTLFVAFVFYGGALLLIPRLMRSAARAPVSRGLRRSPLSPLRSRAGARERTAAPARIPACPRNRPRSCSSQATSVRSRSIPSARRLRVRSSMSAVPTPRRA